ncbi:uncharacterized protein [Epargyreus clarus]|uniref:uncharacterized protein n=1 Tax=Epargyreus clarus TaxID=520877 RepID=UPI003C30437F
MGNTGQSVTLANSIIGVGILAMPFCFQQCGVLLATLILVLMGLVSRLCCHFLLKSAIITRRRNFEFLAFHVFGPSGKMAVEVGIIGFLMGTCIAYFVVVGDLGPQIIAKLLNINQSDILRTSIMVIVSLVCVLPLGLLRNVDSLSNVSAATIGFYFCLVIKVVAEAAGQLLAAEWARVAMWRPAGLLQCVPIISMALFCQTQLFEIFESMPSLSLEKMNLVTKNAINICTVVYFTLGVFGYVAFGSQDISGNILMSLSPTMASDVIKLGFVMSLAFSFPLIIFPCRASLYSFLYRKPHSSHHDHIINHSIPEATFRCITVSIVAVALFISLLIPNIELVLGLVGSTIGVVICVVFPAACFVNVTFKNTNERVLAKVVIVLGLIILVLGTYANLQAAENTRDKYDDKQITQERIDKIVEDFFEKRDKDEGVMENPNAVVDSLPKVQINKINGDIIKDSVVQPPNPVPPESHSDEKLPPLPIIPNLKEETLLKEILPEVVKDPVDRVSESHPKNLQNKMPEAKLSNGIRIIEKAPEKPKEIEIKSSSQEKIDMQKQQQLIETIKQHGEEQKELIKEQKEILDEIKKTKKEMQKNKKEVDSVEAKKIAVESIQKIANMAIQSLSGVTEKPVDNVAKAQEPIQKIADEAVHEIAKKAADAIKEIKHLEEKVEPIKVPQDNAPVINNVVPNLLPAPNNPPEKQLQGNPNLQNNINVNVPASVQDISKQGNIVSNLNQQNNVQPNVNKPDETKVNKPMEIVEKKIEVPIKEHSHSPDEPQSYKQGEDAQKNIVPEVKPLSNGIPQNVPLPIAMRENPNNVDTSHLVQNPKKPDTLQKKIDNINNVNINNVNNNLNEIMNGAVEDTRSNNVPLNVNSDNLVRQKREVDCTEKTLLKPEDKQICENPEETPVLNKHSEEISNPNMNYKDIGLPNNLPVQEMALHHIRSLKTYDENKEK